MMVRHHLLPQDWLRHKLKASEEELLNERDCVGHLIPGSMAAVCRINDTGDTTLPGAANTVDECRKQASTSCCVPLRRCFP